MLRPTSPLAVRRPHRRRLRRLAAGATAVVVVWLGVGVVLRAEHSGEVLPGTRVAGIEVGGLSPAEARQALASAFPPGQTVTLGYRDQRFTVRAQEIGYRVDVAATVQRAYRAGREGALGGLWEALPSPWRQREVAPVVEVERSRLDAVVASIARRIDRPAFPGSLAVDVRPLAVRTVAPRSGRAVERSKAAELVVAALRDRARTIVPLPVRTRPAVARHHVEAVARDARAYLEKPVQLRRGGTTVTLARRDIAPILDVERAPEAASRPVRLGVDRDELERLVDELANDLQRDPVDARVTGPARPLVVDTKGDLSWRPRRASTRVTRGRAGRTLDRSATAAALASAVRRHRHTARLPLERVPASLTTRAARRVRSILGTFTTRFACCQPRTTNIELMAKAVDKTVIRPGQRFSLNRVAGPRTRAKGYKPAPFIADGKIVPSVGGGVSQFSTTMYNAAYFAGLRLDHHQPHSFYISRYPPGREATLDYTSIDLVWTNDTNTPVLIRAAADATSVTVTLYGASSVRRVEARSGPRTPRPDGGFAITVTRSIAFPGGRETRQQHTTAYDSPPAE